MCETDFKQLAEAAESQQTRENMDALWRAVFSLEQWYFIARGNKDKPTPFASVVNGKPFLMGFTSTEGAQVFYARNKLDDGKSHGILSIPSRNTAYFTSFAQHGVFGILFNDHEKGFYTPLTNIQPMYDYFVVGKS